MCHVVSLFYAINVRKYVQKNCDYIYNACLSVRQDIQKSKNAFLCLAPQK